MGEFVSDRAILAGTEDRLTSAFNQYLGACRKIDGEAAKSIGDVAAVVVARARLRRALDAYMASRNQEPF